MKIYAKQINPEFQESLLFEDGLFPENMVVCGNRDFKERKTAVFTLVENALDNGDLQEALEDLETGGYYSAFYESAQEAIEEFLPPSKGEYSQDDITALQGLVKAYTQCSRAETNNIFAGFFLSWTEKNGAGKLSGVAVRVIGTRFFIPWMIGTGKRWPLLK